MSQPRRRRRRGRRGRGSSGSPQGSAPREQASQIQPQPGAARAEGSGKRRRRRRGRSGTGRIDDIPSPKLSEDLFALLTRTGEPTAQMAEPDGTVLEELIGELQSTWGVPQYPQEYRITIKVADKPERSTPASNGGGGAKSPTEAKGDGPKREKAPSVARLASGDESAPRRKRRRRGRKRRGGSSGGESST